VRSHEWMKTSGHDIPDYDPAGDVSSRRAAIDRYLQSLAAPQP
jgi:hypothetical protein